MQVRMLLGLASALVIRFLLSNCVEYYRYNKPSPEESLLKMIFQVVERDDS